MHSSSVLTDHLVCSVGIVVTEVLKLFNKVLDEFDVRLDEVNDGVENVSYLIHYVTSYSNLDNSTLVHFSQIVNHFKENLKSFYEF